MDNQLLNNVMLMSIVTILLVSNVIQLKSSMYRLKNVIFVMVQ